MIKSAKMTGGYAASLPALKDREFQFTPGLNIIFGSNGSGKTTLARTLAAYCGCQREGGWTRLIPRYDHTDKKFPDLFLDDHAPGMRKVRANVVWDGIPTFYHCAEESDAPVAAFGMPSDGLIDELSRVFLRRDKSSGQNRIIRIEKLAKALATPPKLTQSKNEFHLSVMQYIKNLQQTAETPHRSTLIVDEADRSLDFMYQALLYVSLFPKLAKDHQVIVVSHSPFIFAAPNVNIIEMVPNSLENNRRLIDAATKNSELRSLLGEMVKEEADRKAKK